MTVRAYSDAQMPASSSLVAWLTRYLPLVYLAYALPALVVLSVIMAPFQVPDELSHAYRADQLSRGTPVSPRLGGMVDGGLVPYGEPYMKMWFHPEVKQTAELARRMATIRWGGPDQEASFFNTAQYGPALYLPQAIGIKLGQWTGLTIPQTIVLARILNALAAVAIGAVALALCRHGRALMFTTLLLPMTLSQFGSVSQDALVIALSLLGIGLASRAVQSKAPASTGEFALFALIVALTTMARPSQIGLALLAPAFLGRSDPSWRAKAVLAGAALVPILSWYSLLRGLMPPWPTGVSVSGQFAYLLANPLALPIAMVGNLDVEGFWLFQTLVGVMGWLDTYMPASFYQAAAVALAFSFLAPGNRGPWLRPSVIALAAFAAFCFLHCGALYLTWTPVAKPTIDGLQGRYLLPVLPLLGWLVPSFGLRAERVLNLAWLPVLFFPLATFAVMPGVIAERYYGGWAAMGEALRLLLLP